MAEIIDVLTPKQSQCPTFTVVSPATAGNIAVVPDVSGSMDLAVDGSSLEVPLSVYGRFQSRDNLRLLTAGFYIPESFTLSDKWSGNTKVNTSIAANELLIQVLKSDKSVSTTLPGLGARGVIGLPFANYEMAFDIFCDMSKGNPIGATTFNNTVALPANPSIGDTYKAQVTKNGWEINRYYEWSGAAWLDVTGVPLLADNEYYLSAFLFVSDISMIGVPSLLNGEVIHIVPFIKVLHSLPIIA